MLTTKNARRNNEARAHEEKQNHNQNQTQVQPLLPQGLLPLDDEQISNLLALVAVENHKILRLSLLESF